MKLLDLQPQFVRYEEREGGLKIYHVNVDTIDEAQGIEFLCPRCLREMGGTVGTHRIVCWSTTRGVPDRARPGPGRWLMLGTGYRDLTLERENGRSRSVHLLSGCNWHGYVTGGEVTDA